MGRFGDSTVLGRSARVLSAVAGGLLLANCSGGIGKVDPKYGVSASPRVVQPGEPVPKGGGVYRVGKPYVVAGRTYVPEVDTDYSAVGMASWYGDDFHGRYTANGEIFDMDSITAAHPTLPLPSYVRVTNLSNQRSIVVRVNDRGPFHGNRLIDLSRKTASLLDFHGRGLAKVKVEYVGRAPLAGSDDRKLLATLRDSGPANVKPVMVASAKPFAPAYFDSRPMTRQKFKAGGAAREMADAATAARVPTTELAANARVASDEAAPSAIPMPAPSPVTAYAPPARREVPQAFLNGRGLY
jgi:rare lipoprotein A